MIENPTDETDHRKPFFKYLWQLITIENGVIAFTALFALALRVFIAFNKSYWVDEIVLLQVGEGSVPSIIDFLVIDTNHGPLSWLFAHFWLRVSEAELWMRTPPIIAGILSIYYAYFIARDCGGRRAGILAAVLFCLNVNAITTATDARHYSYLLLFALATIHHYQAALSTGKKRHFILSGLALLLGIYNSHFALFLYMILATHLVGSFIIHLLNPKMGDSNWRKRHLSYAGVCIGVFVLYLPWLPVTLSFFVGPWGIVGGDYWAAATMNQPLTLALKVLFARFGIGGSLSPEYGWTWIIFPALFILMWVFCRKRLSNRLLVTIWFVLPLLITMSIQARHFFAIRYFIVSFPPLLIGAAIGLNELIALCLRLLSRFRKLNMNDIKNSYPIMVLGITFVLISLLSLPFLLDVIRFPQQDWKSAAYYLKQHAKPGDVIQVETGDEIGLRYYLDTDRLGLSIEKRDGAMPWICSGNQQVWVVSHFYVNRPYNFRRWTEGKLEQVKICSGLMIPITIYCYKRDDCIVSDPEAAWWTALSPPESNAIFAPVTLEQANQIPVAHIPANTSATMGWLHELNGNLIATVTFTGPPGIDREALAAFNVDGLTVEHQIHYYNKPNELSTLWQPRENRLSALHLQTANSAVDASVTHVYTAQSLAPDKGLVLDAGETWVKRVSMAQENKLSLLLPLYGIKDDDIQIRIDGNPVTITRKTPADIGGIELPARWGTHIIEISATRNLKIDWIMAYSSKLDNYCKESPTSCFSDRVDGLPAGDYLIAAQIAPITDVDIFSWGWLEIRDAQRGIMLHRCILTGYNNTQIGAMDRLPAWCCDFMGTEYYSYPFKRVLISDVYLAFRKLEGPIEIILHELKPDSLILDSLAVVPFSNSDEAREVLEKASYNQTYTAGAFFSNIGDKRTIDNQYSWYVEGEGKPDYLGWGRYYDLSEGIYGVRASIPESENGNYMLDQNSSMIGSLTNQKGNPEMLTYIEGYKTIEARLKWLGRGKLALGGMEVHELAGPLDTNAFKRLIKDKYLDRQIDKEFNLVDMKELDWANKRNVYP